jgi:hypothetical protein
MTNSQFDPTKIKISITCKTDDLILSAYGTVADAVYRITAQTIDKLQTANLNPQKMQTTKTRTQQLANDIILDFGKLIESGKLIENKHYAEIKGELRFWVAACLEAYRQYNRDCGRGGQNYIQDVTFKRAAKNHPAFLYDKGAFVGGYNRRCVIFSADQLKELWNPQPQPAPDDELNLDDFEL